MKNFSLSLRPNFPKIAKKKKKSRSKIAEKEREKPTRNDARKRNELEWQTERRTEARATPAQRVFVDRIKCDDGDDDDDAVERRWQHGRVYPTRCHQLTEVYLEK